MRQLLSKTKAPVASLDRVNDPDAAAVSAALRDPKAFAVLFDTYWDAIFKFCYYQIGDWHQAEDLASEIFVKALANLAHFDPSLSGSTFRAWLYGIARNTVVSSYRQSARRPAITLDDEPEHAAQGASIEELIIEAERHAELRELLDRLPDDQRELLELRLSGLNAVEIARTLGRSHDAVRKAQSRAITSLRQALIQQQSERSSKGGTHG